MGWFFGEFLEWERLAKPLIEIDYDILGYVPWALATVFVVWTICWYVWVERPSRHKF